MVAHVVPHSHEHRLQQSQAYMNAIYSCARQDSRLEYYRTTYGEEAYKDLQSKLGEFFKEPSDKKQEPVVGEGQIVFQDGGTTTEITVASGYMRIKQTIVFVPRWWQFWRVASVSRLRFYAEIHKDYPRNPIKWWWYTDNGGRVSKGSPTDTKLAELANRYFKHVDEQDVLRKLREIDEKMKTEESLDVSSPEFDPLKKVKLKMKEKVSA